MASRCCDARHASASARWQPAQVSLPTKVAAATAGEPPENASRQPSVRTRNPRLPAMIAVATAAAMTMARHDARRGSASRCRARPSLLLRGAAVDLCDPSFFPVLRLDQATIVTRRTLDRHKLYMRLAAASARVQPARFPWASRRLARAKVAANDACACCSARLTEAGVGWRSSCAPIDCGAIGPAFGFPADWRTAFSNCAILLVQGPACAGAMLRPKATTIEATVARRFVAVAMCCLLHRPFEVGSLLERKDAPPVVLHADHRPAVLL